MARRHHGGHVLLGEWNAAAAEEGEGGEEEEVVVVVALRERDLVGRLGGLSTDLLERQMQSLQQSDLVAVARFGSQPHMLVHRALAALQVVLLSLSLLHETPSVLQVTPWPLLRIELLAHVESIWRKMWKRLARARRPTDDPRRKPLANAQVRFVMQHVLAAKAESCDELLHVYGRVSLVAGSVAAFVLLLTHYSVFPPVEPASAPLSPSKMLLAKVVSRSSCPTMEDAINQVCSSRSESPAATAPPSPPRDEVVRGTQSWRCGHRRNGRFFLFRGDARESTSSPPPAMGSLSVLAIDCRHAAHHWKQSVLEAASTLSGSSSRSPDWSSCYAQSWSKRVVMPSAVAAHVLDSSRRAAAAVDAATGTLSVLLQTSLALNLFSPPLPSPLRSAAVHHSLKSPSDTLSFLLHLVVVVAHKHELKLTAVGSIRLRSMEITLSDVRRQLIAHAPWLLPHHVSPSSSLHFFVRGVLVPTDDEPWRPALELLPFATVCLTHSMGGHRADGASQQRTRTRWRHWLPTLSEMHSVLSSSLCKQLPPPAPSIPSSSPCIETALYPLDEPVSSRRPSPSSPLSRTTDTLLSIVVDWAAFVQFQQLQDSTTILYEHGSPHRSTPAPRAQPRLTSKTVGDACDDDGGESLRPKPTPAELELLALPHNRVRPETEYLHPLYATLTVTAPTTGFLRTPFPADVEKLLADASETTPLRLAVENDECVIHVSRATRADGSERFQFALVFARDAACPLEMLLTMCDAYVWRIAALPKRRQRESSTTPPPRWLRDVLRFVTHPKWDFYSGGGVHGHKPSPPPSTKWPFPSQFFRVAVPHFHMEQAIETTLWSRNIDWTARWRRCDVERDLLRPKYDALCRAHPPSFSIDSIKFSKFLRDCGIQPALLSVGDAAFLFTTHRTPGSQYEMVYEGFVDAMRWIACRGASSASSSSLAGEDDTADADDHHLLHGLCFNWLIRAPSMGAIWQSVVDRWRLEEKLAFMATAATQYCAATRIQANWRRLVTRRVLIETLTRLKNERRAAAKVQSVFKMRKQRACFLKLKAGAVHVQLLFKARRLLRQWRLERAQLVERMRRRLQKWMRQRLRVLRCWKRLNAAWLARRTRILDKRGRLVWAAAYQLESRRYRVSLYKTPTDHAAAADGGTNPLVAECFAQQIAYDLELLEPLTSWHRSIRVTRDTLELLEAETLRHQSNPRKPTHAKDQKRWTLFVLMQRLYLKTKRSVGSSEMENRRQNGGARSPPEDCTVQMHCDPLDTSLGRLIYQGAVREDDAPPADTTRGMEFVRLLLRAHEFTLVTYSPQSSTKRRYSFTAPFVHRILQVAHWHGLTLREEGEDDPAASHEMRARSCVIDALANGSDRLLAVRLLLHFLLRHATTPATRDMMPEEVERRARERDEARQRAQAQEQQRLFRRVIAVQAAARRLLAIRRVQQVALASYTKSMDPARRRIVYTHRRKTDVVMYDDKPRTLRDRDVAPPADLWIPNSDAAASAELLRFFNPSRGVFSRINDVEAAARLQRWFRRVMWTVGLPPWNLRCLTQALLFHHRVQAPTDVHDPSQVERITQFALQRHAIHHDYKAASGLYEAALHLNAGHVPALVGLAALLIYSCRYPAKQTWARGLQLLDAARAADPELSTSLQDVEQNCFRWATFLHPHNADALGNFAVFLQCVRGDLDKAELLYRRAIDLDPANERIVENYVRLQRERTPEGIYASAGPSKIAVWRAQELRRVGGSDWREMEDTGARFPSAERFFQHARTGECTWTMPSVPGGDL